MEGDLHYNYTANYSLPYFDDCISLMWVSLIVPYNKRRTKCHNISNTRRESCYRDVL